MSFYRQDSAETADCNVLLILLEEIEHIARELAEWCPPWQSERGRLLDKANAKLALTMLKNPRYGDIGPQVSALREKLSLAKAVHKACQQPLVPADVARSATTVSSTAVETVIVTNVLFRVRIEIPKISGAAARKQACAGVRKLLAEI